METGDGGPAVRLAAGAVLVIVGALAVALMGDRTSLPAKLIALIVVGTCGISVLVGYALGYYGDRRRGPGTQ
jgi:hypothetical protein